MTAVCRGLTLARAVDEVAEVGHDHNAVLLGGAAQRHDRGCVAEGRCGGQRRRHEARSFHSSASAGGAVMRGAAWRDRQSQAAPRTAVVARHTRRPSGGLRDLLKIWDPRVAACGGDTHRPWLCHLSETPSDLMFDNRWSEHC